MRHESSHTLSSKTVSSSTAVPKELLQRLRNSTLYNKHALPTQDTGEYAIAEA